MFTSLLCAFLFGACVPTSDGLQLEVPPEPEPATGADKRLPASHALTFGSDEMQIQKLEAEDHAGRCDFVKQVAGPTWARQRRHRLLYMYGDSTMRQQYELLCSSLGAWVRPKFCPCLRVSSHCTKELPGGYNLTVMFYGLFEGSYGYPEHLRTLHNGSHVKPDVIYFNGGLHYMHLLPLRQWEHYEVWQNVEPLMAEFLDTASEMSPKLVFMTSHAICQEKYTQGWKEIVEAIRKDPREAAQPCVKWLLQRHKNLTESLALEQCMEGQFVDEGVRKVDERAFKAIKSWEASHPGKVISYVDAFNITRDRCEMTAPGDGRHYPGLGFRELRTLWSELGWADESPADWVKKHRC